MIQPRRTRDASTRFSMLAQRARSDGAAPIIFLALLAVICIGGGASRGDALGQGFVRGTALLAIAGWVLSGAKFDLRAIRAPLIVVAAAMLLAVLQLVPLPFDVWSVLPGRDVFVEVTRATGPTDAWRPLAIVPDGALNALLSLIVPLAILLGMSTLSASNVRRLVPVSLAIVGLSMVVALFQLSTGSVNNPLINDALGQPSGLFANRNHQSLLLCLGVLLAAGWGFAPSRRPDWRGWSGLGLIVILCLLVLATGSRAGLATLAAALILAAILAFPTLRRVNRGRPRWLMPVAGAVGLTIVIGLVLLSVDRGRAVAIDRLFAIDPVIDMRARALPTLRSLIGQFLPWGSGLGSFDPVFRMAEPLDLLKPTYFNHAHNDYAELLLEAGLPGLLLLLGALAWLGRSSWRAWRAEPVAGLHGRLGSAMILLVLVASAVDYPARTPIMMVMLAVAAGWLSMGSGRDPR